MAKVTEKERIETQTEKEQRTMYNRTPLDYQLIPLQKLCRPEVSGMILFKVLKGKKLHNSTMQEYQLQPEGDKKLL